MKGSISKRYSKREGCWVYWGRIHRDGNRHLTKKYKTKSEAREALSRLAVGIHERKVTSEKVPFNQFADEFLENAKIIKRNYEGHFYRLVHLKPFFKGKKLAEITKADIHRYITWRLKAGVKHATVNRELATLKRMFNFAIETERLAVNPMTRFPRLVEEERPVRSVTKNEQERLLAFCRTSNHSVYRLMEKIILLSVHTGMRLSELMWLKWEQVDFESGTIILVKTKAKKKVRLLPINRVVRETMTHLSEEAIDEYVIPFDRTGSVKYKFQHYWRELRKKVKIKARFHDLRATFATRLDRKKTSPFVIKNLMGHSTMDITNRYIGVDDVTRQAVESLAEDEIGSKIGSNSPSDVAKNPPTV